MSKELFLQALRKTKFKKVKILDNEVNVKLLTLNEISQLKFTQDVDTNVKLITTLFFDIDTNEPVFTEEFLKNEIPNTLLVEIYKAAIAANMATDENIEKN